MKRFVYRFTIGLISLILLSSVGEVLAACPTQEPSTEHAKFWKNPTLIDNICPGFLNEQGKNVQLFRFNDTVYMPLRTAGEWLGCTVEWKQDSKTVTLTSEKQPYYLSLTISASLIR